LGFKYAEFLGRNVAEMMVKRGFTKASLARDSGVARTALDSILSCESNPELKTLDKIAEKLGVDTLDLLKPNFDPKASVRLTDTREVRKASDLLTALAADFEVLSERIEGIPVDVLDMLVGQDKFVFDQIRNILEPLQETKAATKAKSPKKQPAARKA
jgi:transcriptional regulator with XRE-family HTH domain